MSQEVKIHISDLKKIRNCLQENKRFHTGRDQKNAAIHMAEKVDSPLSSTTKQTLERVEKFIEKIEN